MKKKILIIILTTIITLLPMSILASEFEDSRDIILVDSITDTETNSNNMHIQNVSLEYKPNEQMIHTKAPAIGCKAAFVINPTTRKGLL